MQDDLKERKITSVHQELLVKITENVEILQDLKV